jgi:hypothetical protein
VKYYANEYMNGHKRYDYAIIEFVSDDGTIATCPAMILGFVQYNITVGIPTPQFTGEEELTLNTIQKTWLLTTTYMWWFIQHQIMCQVNNWKKNCVIVYPWRCYELCVYWTSSP